MKKFLDKITSKWHTMDDGESETRWTNLEQDKISLEQKPSIPSLEPLRKDLSEEKENNE